jgi:hypothetical protein
MQRQPPRPSAADFSSESRVQAILARVVPLREQCLSDSVIPCENLSSPFSIAQAFFLRQLGPDRVLAPSDQRVTLARSRRRPNAALSRARY